MNARKADLQQADALVLFGATGDLAKKKLFPALYSMALNNSLHCSVIGVASTKWDHAQFTTHAVEAIAKAYPNPDPKILAALDADLSLVVQVHSTHLFNPTAFGCIEPDNLIAPFCCGLLLCQ